MEEIPVCFEHKGEKYNCRLCKVFGAGDTSTWHLMDNKNYYLGRLRSSNNKWIFDGTRKTKELEESADYVGDLITAWYE